MSNESSINLRIPQNLKDELKGIAQSEGRSLNKQIVHVLFRFILDYNKHHPQNTASIQTPKDTRGNKS